jgi:hypothetical protein
MIYHQVRRPVRPTSGSTPDARLSSDHDRHADPGTLCSMRALTADLSKRELRPYFLWDEDVSIGELHEILAGPDGPRRDQLLAKMLREARDIDVWQFVRPSEVARVLERLRRRIGRRYAFWTFLIEGWHAHGLLRA